MSQTPPEENPAQPPVLLIEDSVPASAFDSFATFANQSIIPFRFSSASMRNQGREAGRAAGPQRYHIAKRQSTAAENHQEHADVDADAGDDGYSGDTEREVSRAEAYKLEVIKRWRAEARGRKLSNVMRC
jgi:hypothetical protein